MSEISLEAAKLIRCVAGPRRADDTIKKAIYRAARRLSWSLSRTKDVWYLAARRIDADEMDALRAAARQYEENVADAAANALAELRSAIRRAEDVIASAESEATERDTELRSSKRHLYLAR